MFPCRAAAATPARCGAVGAVEAGPLAAGRRRRGTRYRSSQAARLEGSVHATWLAKLGPPADRSICPACRPGCSVQGLVRGAQAGNHKGRGSRPSSLLYHRATRTRGAGRNHHATAPLLWLANPRDVEPPLPLPCHGASVPATTLPDELLVTNPSRIIRGVNVWTSGRPAGLRSTTCAASARDASKTMDC